MYTLIFFVSFLIGVYYVVKPYPFPFGVYPVLAGQFGTPAQHALSIAVRQNINKSISRPFPKAHQF